MEKKYKADEKRKRRLERKQNPEASTGLSELENTDADDVNDEVST
ncbi:hypothetical protein [Novipirellula artificiosorum]|uniref:Uncharacterized protein n=1 Tax=Novipirellula artificiosorum TaxID=2528016 RepID=A0A5C6DHP5_9BACT|nr:hypothetical protein [Novipirellula artificiosorum]TWU34479.1 hypothetical protein Poly41_46270 [Novipirellula artificiosorum]